MKKVFLIVCVFFAAFVFSQDNCDCFIYTTKDLSAEKHPTGIYNGKINYSRVYANIPFLEEFKPGVYIFATFMNTRVNAFVYVPENSDEIDVYMEPSISRNPGHDTFYPCVDRHVKANIDYFRKTCIKKKKISNKGVFSNFLSVMDDKYVGLEEICGKESRYFAQIYEKRNDGSVRILEIEDLSVLDSDVARDPLFRSFRSIDSLIVDIVGDDVEKCSWYNLVPDPKKFSAEKYHDRSYNFLKEKDCPAL